MSYFKYLMSYFYIDFLRLAPGWNYNLNVVKDIRVSDAYMSLDDSIRLCSSESYESCFSRIHLERITQQCGCIPLHLINYSSSKVCTGCPRKKTLLRWRAVTPSNIVQIALPRTVLDSS